MEVADVQQHPCYTCNRIALRSGVVATLFCATFTLSYAAPYNFILTAAVVLLATIFLAIERVVLPRIRTFAALDRLVVAYCIPINLTQLFAIWCFPAYEVSTGTGCMIVISALLYYSINLHTAYMLLTILGWILLKWYVDGVPHANEVVQLALIAPIVSLIVRKAVYSSLNAMHAARLREQETVSNLSRTLEKLREETSLREAAESQLRQAQKHEGLGIMAVGVAHDFNNTLAAINALAELISLSSNDVAACEHATDIIHSVKQASGVCRQMLTYAGKSTSQMAAVDVNKLLSEMRPLVQATAGKRVSIRIQYCPVQVFIFGNESQLQQVVLNLVKNSVEAIPERGSVIISVDVMHELPNDRQSLEHHVVAPNQQPPYVIVSVADTGSGMDSETVRQMFDPYFTTKGVGHGFGLSNVLGIAKTHNASLMVQSELGNGTKISLVFSSLACDAEPTAQCIQKLNSVSADSIGSRVLLVDDDALVRDSLGEILEFQGWEVIKADSGESALLAFKQTGEFAALIIDFNMPGMNGSQTLKQLRQLGCTAPAILCSGHLLAPQKNDVLSDFQAFLAKPFLRNELDETLRRITISQATSNRNDVATNQASTA